MVFQLPDAAPTTQENNRHYEANFVPAQRKRLAVISVSSVLPINLGVFSAASLTVHRMPILMLSVPNANLSVISAKCQHLCYQCCMSISVLAVPYTNFNFISTESQSQCYQCQMRILV